MYRDHAHRIVNRMPKSQLKLYYNKQQVQPCMSTVYNLRNKPKALSPLHPKQQFQLLSYEENTSPKTESKMEDHMHALEKTHAKDKPALRQQQSLENPLQSSRDHCHKPTGRSSEVHSLPDLHLPRLRNRHCSETEKNEDPVSSVLTEQRNVFKTFRTENEIPREEPALEASNYKKSYKNMNPARHLGIPYRKFETQTESKIVAALNKIKIDKICQKQIERLIGKIQQASQKEIRNKFFVSGVRVLVAVMKSAQLSDSVPIGLVDKFQVCYRELLKRIEEQLDSFQDFCLFSPARGPEFDETKLFRKVYQILRKKLRHQQRQHVQDKCTALVNKYIGSACPNLKMLYQELSAI